MVPSAQGSLRVLNPANQSHLWRCPHHRHTPTPGDFIIHLYFSLEVVSFAESQLASLLKPMKTIQGKQQWSTSKKGEIMYMERQPLTDRTEEQLSAFLYPEFGFYRETVSFLN